MIKIFDCCSHPTLTGKFNDYNSTFKSLSSTMKKNKIYKACAMGLDDFEKYDHIKFINQCNKYKNLVPIAGINPIKNDAKIIKELKLIKKLGFKGVKLHNRISNFDLSNKKFISFLKLLEKTNLVCLICCYWHADINKYPKNDFLHSLIDAFKKVKKLKTILVHGGNVRLLEFAELVRSNNTNFLLDLSMTMIKYEGSSIDDDIKFLFKNFDERICVGSDHPEYSHEKFRERFDFFSKGLTLKKKENIAFKNLERFFS